MISNKLLLLISILFVLIFTNSCSQSDRILPNSNQDTIKKQTFQLETQKNTNISICTYERCTLQKLPAIEFSKDCSKVEGISKSDCKAIIDQNHFNCSTALCIQIISMLTNNIELCYLDIINNSNSCFIDVTEYNKNVKQCENFKGNILECIKWTSKTLNSWEDCKILNNNEHKRECAINTQDYNFDKNKRSTELNDFLEKTITSSDRNEMILSFCKINSNSNVKNYKEHIECCNQYNLDKNYNNFKMCEEQIS